MPYILHLRGFAAVFLVICVCASFAGYAVAKANPLLAMITERVMSRVDLNGDGKVDREEFAAARDLHFSSADANGDGYIERSEFAVELTRVMGEMAIVWADQFFAAMDRDGDNLLSRDEVEMLGEAMFTQLDKDEDGFVTPSDIHPSLALTR